MRRMLEGLPAEVYCNSCRALVIVRERWAKRQDLKNCLSRYQCPKGHQLTLSNNLAHAEAR